MLHLENLDFLLSADEIKETKYKKIIGLLSPLLLLFNDASIESWMITFRRLPSFNVLILSI
jgi:hypothetical protein